MYIGRIVAVGRTANGDNAAMYRVSSRSFPNRRAVEAGQNIAIIPREGCESDLAKNPYISYNCLRIVRNGEWAVASNGSQTDPIAEKIDAGMPPRDAITLGLSAMDYEKDSLDTPRIVSVAHKSLPIGYLGIIRKDAVLVREFDLKDGELHYISTYECNSPCDKYADNNFNAVTAADAAQYVVDGGVFADFTNSVTSAAAVVKDGEFERAVLIV